MRWLICGTLFGLVLGLAIAAPVARLFEQGRVKHFRLPVRLELEIGDAPPAEEATVDDLRVATAEPLPAPLSAILESREQVGSPISPSETAQFAEALKQVAAEEQHAEESESSPPPAAEEPLQPENPAICPPGAN